MYNRQTSTQKIFSIIKNIFFIAALYIPFALLLEDNIEHKTFELISNYVNSQTDKRKELVAYNSENATDYLDGFSASYILGAQNSGAQASQRQRIVTTDRRVIAMRDFLRDYNSPMYPYSEQFIISADEHNLDWRLVAAISGVESAFGNLIPYHPAIGTSYNAWGWSAATHPQTGERWSYFENWNQGIDTITYGLATGYGTGNLDPYLIVDTYCPPCGATPGKPWASAVTGYMNELSFYEAKVDVL